MPRSKSTQLGDLLNVLSPFSNASSMNIQVADDGNLEHTMQEVLTSLKTKNEVPSPATEVRGKISFPHLVPAREWSQSNMAIRPMLYDYTKMCKTIDYLPNPFSTFMKEEGKLASLKVSC